MNCQGRVEKKNKIKTLGTERCENIDTLYINKIVIIIIKHYPLKDKEKKTLWFD
jgi:hypothetical protein